MTKKPIDEMMQLIQNNTHHEDIGRYLDEADLSVEELLELNHALYNFNAKNWELKNPPMYVALTHSRSFPTWRQVLPF
jgi:hypothetical protein